MDYNDTTRFLSFKNDFVNDIRKAITDLKDSNKVEVLFSEEKRKLIYAECNNRYLLVDDNNGVTSVYQDMHYLPGRMSLDVKAYVNEVKSNPKKFIQSELPMIVQMKNDFNETYTQAQFDRFMSYSGKERSLDDETNNPLIVKHLKGKIGKKSLDFNHAIGQEYLTDRLYTSSNAADVYDLVKALENFELLPAQKYNKDFFLKINENYASYFDGGVGEIVEKIESISHGLLSYPDKKKDHTLYQVNDKYIVMVEHENICVIEKTGDWGFWNVYQTKHDSANKFLNTVIEGKADKLENLVLEVNDYFTVSATESYVHRLELALTEIVEEMESQRIVPDKSLNRKLN